MTLENRPGGMAEISNLCPDNGTSVAIFVQI
jgi:hypothetical protein